MWERTIVSIDHSLCPMKKVILRFASLSVQYLSSFVESFQIMQFNIGYRYAVPDAKNCGNCCDRMHDMHMPEGVGEHKELR